MNAADVMTTNVATVGPGAEVQEIARLMLRRRISAVPVVDATKRVIGIVSEGDLVRRLEKDSETRHPWWLEELVSTRDVAAEYVKAQGKTASDVMTREVITVEEATPLGEIAGLLETHHIKRVPVTRDGRLVGIVSRANLLQGLFAIGSESAAIGALSDSTIRGDVLQALFSDAGLDTEFINVVVTDGVVRLWGAVYSPAQRRAAQIASANQLGVKSVENHLKLFPAWEGQD